MASPKSIATDVTNEVHPDNRALAVHAAWACMLDVAGIDFRSDDISVSWRVNHACIIEVNSGPAADLHMFPQSGQARDVSWHLIRSCLPAASPGRLPVVMCLVDHHSPSSLTHLLIPALSARMTELGHQVGIYEALPGHSLNNQARAVASLMTNPAFDAAVIAWPQSSVARLGFPLDRVRVMVIPQVLMRPSTNMYDWGEEECLRICRQACDLATDSVIIDGTQPILRAAVAHRPADQVGYLWWIDEATSSEALFQHLAAGGWAITPAQPTTDTEQSSDSSRAYGIADAIAKRLANNKADQKVHPCASLVNKALDDPSVSWTPAILSTLFGGAWVNGPDHGWQVTRVSTELSELRPGDLFVCMGSPDDLTSTDTIQTKIFQAFTRGARAVVATQVPPDLQRWQPILVCDDPAAGLKKAGFA